MSTKMRKLTELLLTLGTAVGLLFMLYSLANEKDGVLRIVKLDSEIERQLADNRKLEIDNSLLRAQIADVKRHPEIKEAMARYQLNMIRQGEVFIQTPLAE